MQEIWTQHTAWMLAFLTVLTLSPNSITTDAVEAFCENFIMNK